MIVWSMQKCSCVRDLGLDLDFSAALDPVDNRWRFGDGKRLSSGERPRLLCSLVSVETGPGDDERVDGGDDGVAGLF